MSSLLTEIIGHMNLLKDYFYYSKKERLAVLVLSALILFIVLIGVIQRYLHTPLTTELGTWQEELVAFQEQQYTIQAASKSYKKASWKNKSSRYPTASFSTPATNNKPLQPFSFDPNTVSAEELEQMGVPQKAIKSWMNYRNKGGYFKNKASVSKVYNLQAENYEQLKDYIQLPEEQTAAASMPLPAAFDFDPNTSSAEEFQQLGLSSKTIKSILNYRSKGGYFKEASDFKKIYTLPDSVYQHVAPHIQIVAQPQQRNYPARKARSYTVVDINTAEQTDFEQFRGIGPSYARRLLELRERLGGFIHVDQVGELYRLADSTFQQMRPFLRCVPISITQININTATVQELQAHPYLRWSHAKAIVQYREQKGAWKSVELLQILPELDDGKNTFERIRPYLTH
ncbi:MAG: helix-hairpin-helix domain-containing protein [Aureispira sp.]